MQEPHHDVTINSCDFGESSQNHLDPFLKRKKHFWEVFKMNLISMINPRFGVEHGPGYYG